MQDIYVDDIGKGLPLVLVHGFLGSSKMWSPQKKFLKKETLLPLNLDLLIILTLKLDVCFWFFRELEMNY